MKDDSITLQSLIDTIPFYVMLIDAEHKILMTNKAIKRDLGLAAAQVIGQYCPKVVHGTDEPYPGCPLEEALETGGNIEREFWDPRTQRWVNSAIYATGQKSGDGKAIFLHFIMDITRRKQSEEKIQQSYESQSIMNAILKLSLEEIPLDRLLQKVLDLILTIPWMLIDSKGAIFLVEEVSQILALTAHRNLPPEVRESCARLSFGTCICGQAAVSRELQFVDRVDHRHTMPCADRDPHGHYCVPIEFSGEALGVINLYLKEGKAPDQREQAFLLAIANLLAGIIKRKRMDLAIRSREQELQIKTQNLKEMNAALKVLLEKRDEDKVELEEKVLSNVQKLVVPYLDKLKASSLNHRQAGYVEVLEANLNTIISPFAQSLAAKYYHLTPLELRVADLIRQGKTSKEMAEMLNLSVRTIDFHRQNIRHKLGLKNKKANLRSQLLSFK